MQIKCFFLFSSSFHTLMLIWNRLVQQILPCDILPCDTVQNLQLIYIPTVSRAGVIIFSCLLLFSSYLLIWLHIVSKIWQNYVYIKILPLCHCQYWGYPVICKQLISRWPNIINKLSVLCVINMYNKFGRFKLVEKTTI